MIFKGFPLFCHNRITPGNKFDSSTFVTTYLGIPLFIIMYFGHKIYSMYIGHIATGIIKPGDCDLYSGKAHIDAEEAEYLAAEAERKGGPETKMEKFYRHTLGYVF